MPQRCGGDERMEISVSEHEFGQAMATAYYAMTPGRVGSFSNLPKEEKKVYDRGFRAFVEFLGIAVRK